MIKDTDDMMICPFNINMLKRGNFEYNLTKREDMIEMLNKDKKFRPFIFI